MAADRDPAIDDTAEARRAAAIGLVAEAALGDGLGALLRAPGDADAEGVLAAEDTANVEETADSEEAADRPDIAEANIAEDGAADEGTAREGTAEADVRGEGSGEAGIADGADTRSPGRRATAVVGRAERFQVVVHVSAETLAGEQELDISAETLAGEDARRLRPRGRLRHRDAPRIEHGPHLSAETARRLACDAGMVVMTHDRNGDVLDVGRRRRSVPTALRRALDRRDGHCRFPGCTLRFCDAHHVRHWAHEGVTALDNLVLLCRHHHRRVHEDGWRVEPGEAGELRLYRPDGRLLPRMPDRPPAPDRPVRALERRHERRGLEIGPWTATPDWDGTPLDVDWALFVLRGPGPARVSAETPGSPVVADAVEASATSSFVR